ncbi:ComEC family competence protein [Candidatus Parcubacteria bacterium]|nr:MAG: ComEC family competence protein [Candidatus Parcubacteria bacterium]
MRKFKHGGMHAADKFALVLVGFLIGIGVWGIGISLFWGVAIGIAIGGIFARLLRPRRAVASAAFLCAIAVIGGGWYAAFYDASYRARVVFPERGTEVKAIITSEPKISETTQILSVALRKPFYGYARVMTDSAILYRYGQIISFRWGETTALPRNREKPILLFPRIRAVSSQLPSSILVQFRAALLRYKENLVAALRHMLPADHAALLAGVTFGWRGAFSRELANAMALSGTTHIVALSGYNIAIVVLLVGSLLGAWLPRRWAFVLTILTIVVFVGMVGGEPSIIRAALMGVLALLARHTGRIYSMRNEILFAAAIMAAVRPSIVFEAGFQLSFLALLGIIYLEPLLLTVLQRSKQFFSFLQKQEFSNRLSRRVAATFITTLAAQIAVAPVLLATFHRLSLGALFANILILEVVPFTMALGAIAALGGVTVPLLGTIVAWAAYPLLSYEILVMRVFAKLRFPLEQLFSPVTVPFLMLAAGAVAAVLLIRRSVWEKERRFVSKAT